MGAQGQRREEHAAEAQANDEGGGAEEERCHWTCCKERNWRRKGVVGGDDSALEMLNSLSSSWVQGLLGWMDV